MKKSAFKIAISIFCVILPFVCSAKIFEQKDHFFKINAPEGWQCIEQTNKVLIINSQNHNGIVIQFAYKGKYSSDENKKRLIIGEQTMTEYMKRVMNGTDIKVEETQLGGIYARRLTGAVTVNGQAGNMITILLFYQGYVFEITFEDSNKNEIAEMKKSIETIQFE